MTSPVAFIFYLENVVVGFEQRKEGKEPGSAKKILNLLIPMNNWWNGTRPNLGAKCGVFVQSKV